MKKYNAWAHKFENAAAYKFTQLSPAAQKRSVSSFNMASYLPQGYEPDYCEIMAEAVWFSKTGLVLSC